MMTLTPAKIMGLTGKGRLSPGMDADIAVFDEDIRVKAVFAKGELVNTEAVIR
jgi:N-acetylglucosamine-6-phosphate deacetylase